MGMVHKKDWGPGYRFFLCEDCGTEWKEKSRDCSSYSSSPCINPTCENMYGVSPFDNDPHYEWPTDQWGNLVDENG